MVIESSNSDVPFLIFFRNVDRKITKNPSYCVYFSVYSLFKDIFLPSIDANSSSSISSKVLFRFGITAVALDAVSHSAAVLIRFLLEAGSISDSFTLYKNIIKFK